MPTFSVSGTVRFASYSEPVTGEVWVGASNDGGSTIQSSTTASDADGSYTLTNIPQGNTTVYATKSAWSIGQRSVNVTSNLTDQDIGLTPESWSIVYTNEAYTLNDIISIEGDMLAAGAGSPVLVWNNAGWAALPTGSMGTANDLVTAFDTSPEDEPYYVIDSASGIYHTATPESGTDWKQLAPQVTSESIVEFIGLGEMIWFVVTAGQELIFTQNQGGDWINVTPAGKAINGADSSDFSGTWEVTVVGDDGYIAHVPRNAAATDISAALGTTEDLLGISYDFNDTFLVVSQPGSIFASTDDGVNWQTVLTGVPLALRGAWVHWTDVEPYVVGEKGLIMRYSGD